MKICYVVHHPIAGCMKVYDNELTAKMNCHSDCTVKRFVELSDEDIILLGNAKKKV